MADALPSARIDMRAASTTSSLMLLLDGVAMMPASSMRRAAACRAARARCSPAATPASSTARADSTIASMESYP